MKILGVIPARMAASRFPNKPMVDILGMPMIAHCFFRTSMSSILDDVYVATCDSEIYSYIKCIGGNAIMTKDSHERASDRTAEALLNIESMLENVKYDIIVMIQGDEPLIDPRMIDEVVEPLIHGNNMVSNLRAVLTDANEIVNSNNVKVVSDINDYALYMSREPIPSSKKQSHNFTSYRQLGLIAFTREAILKFVSLETTMLEIIESVDMNRFLEHRIPIYMVTTKYDSDAVDTPDDLLRVKIKMKDDHLFKTYNNITK
jgi:3-deoxy-manno-octulosonate cytidylyltransferase (CMP-KDO synthetase)